VKPRVLFIGGFPPPDSPIKGGIVTSCRLLLESSFRERFELVLVDSTQRSIPKPGAFRRGVLALKRLARVIWLVERRRPQALLLFSSQGGSFIEKSAAAVYARARGIPTVFLMRGGPFMDDCRSSRAYRWLARLLMRAPAVIPCQGEAWRRFFRDELGVPESKLPIVYNWTAPPEYFHIPAPDPTPGRPLRVLFMAWIDRPKGVFDLLEAARALRSDGETPPFELHFAGGGADEDELRDHLGSGSLSDWVHYHGWVDGEAKRNLLESADIYSLPSYSEGMPNSVIEAMAAGRPVVVTPVGAIPDVVRDGENGLVVPVRDREALAAAIGRLLSSEVLRRQLGESGRETARAMFSVEPGATALERCLRVAMRTE
jgi:glycosyltransferase involved in cell wall biosynthesis